MSTITIEGEREAAKDAKQDAKKREGMNAFDFRVRQSSNLDTALEDVAYAVIGAAIEVHRILGPGLTESHYQKALSHELTLRRIEHHREVETLVLYKGVQVGTAYLDFVVVGRLTLELKSVEALTDLHCSQALTYLRLRNLQLALLINFNVPVLHDGVRRVINTH